MIRVIFTPTKFIRTLDSRDHQNQRFTWVSRLIIGGENGMILVNENKRFSKS